MIIKAKILSTLAVLYLLSACGADVGIGRPPSAENPIPEMPPQTRGRFIDTLPAQDLDKGECAVFLWGEETSRPLVFTQNIKTDWASVIIERRDRKMQRTQASEIIIPGFYARQSFSDGRRNLDVRLKPDDGRNLFEGIKIPSGVLTIKKQDGSENIVAVSGLLGCNIDNL